MTFDQIKTEVENLRFNTSATKAAQVANWVNQAELWVWNQADWNFKRMTVQSATPTLVGGLARYDLGTATGAISKVTAVYLASDGTPLVYMLPDEWEALYAVGTPPSGTPEAYTIMDTATAPPVHRGLFIGPASTQALSIASRRRYYHLNNSGNYVAGVMSATTDTPCWDSEFHYILVLQAMMLGMALENDPTVEGLRAQRNELLAMMKDELTGTTQEVLQVWSEATVGSVWR